MIGDEFGVEALEPNRVGSCRLFKVQDKNAKERRDQKSSKSGRQGMRFNPASSVELMYGSGKVWTRGPGTKRQVLPGPSEASTSKRIHPGTKVWEWCINAADFIAGFLSLPISKATTYKSTINDILNVSAILSFIHSGCEDSVQQKA